MKLGLILSIGESFSDLKKHGQDVLVRDQNLKAYSKKSEKVYVFSYENEKYPLFKNNHLVVNKQSIHRYFYSFLMPILHFKEFKDCDVLRGFQTTGGIPCLLAKFVMNKPFVINYGYDYESVSKIEGNYIVAFFYKIVNFIVLRSANAVIVTNPTFVNKIKKMGVKRISIIPNSVNIKLFMPPNKKQANKIKKIVFVGRLEPQKNIVNLLKALQGFEYQYRLLIIGRGSQKKYLQKFAIIHKLNVTFVDSVSHNKLPKILQTADIFVLPSLEEGHPKVLLEAMAVGLACVATNVQGIKEIIKNGQTGILTNTQPAGIKLGIEKVLSNPRLAQKVGENAREFVREHFNATILMAKEIKLLKSLAS